MAKEIKKIQTDEMVSLVSGYTVSGINFPDNYDRIADILQHAVDFNYSKEVSPRENLLAYGEKLGFAEGLRAAAEDYKIFCRTEKPTFLIDTSINARGMAYSHGVPCLEIEVEIPERTSPDTVEKKEKPAPKPVKKIIELVDLNWKDEVICNFCGKVLRSWKLDKTGYALGHDDCTCEGYKSAKAKNETDN